MGLIDSNMYAIENTGARNLIPKQIYAEPSLFNNNDVPAQHVAYASAGLIPSAVLLFEPTGASICVYSSDKGLSNGTQRDLAFIQSTFSLTKLELSECCKVTRKTLDAWLTGTSPRESAAKRIFNLYMAADAFASTGFELEKDLLKRPVLNGLSVIDMLKLDTIDTDGIVFASSQLFTQHVGFKPLKDPFAQDT